MGFCSVEVAPSPKSQIQEAGSPVEVSVNVTPSGTVPLRGLAWNPAMGGPRTRICIVFVERSVPLETVRLTV